MSIRTKLETKSEDPKLLATFLLERLYPQCPCDYVEKDHESADAEVVEILLMRALLNPV